MTTEFPWKACHDKIMHHRILVALIGMIGIIPFVALEVPEEALLDTRRVLNTILEEGTNVHAPEAYAKAAAAVQAAAQEIAEPQNRWF